METKSKKSEPRASRNVWITEALKALEEEGIGGLKIVRLAKNLGLTSGSFYWHFKDLNELEAAVLDHWERRLTDMVIAEAREFNGSPQDRILNLMFQVIHEDAARYDHAVSVWAKTNPKVLEIFERIVQQRFGFAAWMFEQAGFDPAEAAARGRLMVTALMGESSTRLKANENWEETLRKQWKLLVSKA